MPKVILEYNIPEEQDEFDLAYNGARLAVIVEDFDEYLRRKLKYESDSLTEEQYKLYQEIRDKLTELRNE